MRFAAVIPVVLALWGCQSVPDAPTIWTVGDLADAIETNLAKTGREVAGTWAPAGAGCASALFDMSLGNDRPPFMPDVAALAALVPGTDLTYEGQGPGEQVYRLGGPGSQATIVRDLRTDGITWRRPNGDEMRLFPDSISFQSGRLSLLIGEDAISIQIGGASLLEFERCG